MTVHIHNFKADPQRPLAESMTLYQSTYRLPDGTDFLTAIREALASKRCGRMTLHMNSGSVGLIEWIERNK